MRGAFSVTFDEAIENEPRTAAIKIEPRSGADASGRATGAQASGGDAGGIGVRQLNVIQKSVPAPLGLNVASISSVNAIIVVPAGQSLTFI